MATVLVVIGIAVAATPLYKTPGAPIEDRVNDLLNRMNLEEKANQLVIPFGAKFPDDYIKAGYNTSGLGGTYPLRGMLISCVRIAATRLRDCYKGYLNSWCNLFCLILAGGWEVRNEWQRNAVENSRLGIPTSFIAETLHSSYAQGITSSHRSSIFRFGRLLINHTLSRNCVPRASIARLHVEPTAC